MKVQASAKAMMALENYIISMMEEYGMKRVVFDEDHPINYLSGIEEVFLGTSDDEQTFDEVRLIFKQMTGSKFAVDEYPAYWYWLKIVEKDVEDFIKRL